MRRSWADRGVLCAAGAVLSAVVLWQTRAVAAGPTAASQEDAQSSAASSGDDSWRWQQDAGSIGLVQGGSLRWRYQFADGLTKPYFDPVATTDGQVLTWNSPPDHPWHHGLWWSWKYINGLNYWEPNPQTGRPPGETQWSEAVVETRDDQSATISMQLRYAPEGSAESVLTESRTIVVGPPDASGAYAIDWSSRFVAVVDATLDRTPPKEQSWGGYAGLSVRFAEELKDRRAMGLEGPAAFDGGNRHRSRDKAMEYQGVVDGQPVGLAFLDHPQNPRYPTPWYLIRSPEMSYINAALLNDEPLELAQGEALRLQYRLIVHPGHWDAARLRAAAAHFGDLDATQQ